MVKIEQESTEKYFIIYINKLLHLKLVKSKFIGLQSWKDNITTQPIKWFIEITLDTREILLEYDSEDKWQQILKLLEYL